MILGIRLGSDCKPKIRNNLSFQYTIKYQQKSVMNILQGVKPTNNQKSSGNATKFIIKSKPSIKQNKPTQYQNEGSPNYASNQDVIHLINYIVTKSKKLSQFLQTKSVSDLPHFHNKHLFENPCIRTFLKSLMDKMLAERRLGKSLKGINKGILVEIQNSIWPSIEREVTLYQLDKMYEKQKSSLETELKTRREEIQRQIQQLKLEPLQKCLILKQSDQNLS